jgi:hypothetical protein
MPSVAPTNVEMDRKLFCKQEVSRACASTGWSANPSKSTCTRIASPRGSRRTTSRPCRTTRRTSCRPRPTIFGSSR